MTIGLLITRDGFTQDIIGLTKAAVKKGHQVILFMMDDGARHSQNKDIVALKDLPGVSMSLCDHSAKLRNITEDMIPAGCTAGSQYQNSVMNQDADRVLLI
ncbi:DsrE family protein [Candidatus Magnetomonas plexicatena]|uniref:DsrE family protein n=1 Tax=Candidatus Magnetomonas plexicatena TaxID=2552947 RepID=UPI001C784C94|nr:DsrE family protein [Nitrospirales bacterium LBB_01]